MIFFGFQLVHRFMMLVPHETTGLFPSEHFANENLNPLIAFFIHKICRLTDLEDLDL